MGEAKGTFACPICGWNEPHHHSNREVRLYREKQMLADVAQREKREFYQHATIAKRDERKVKLEAELQEIINYDKDHPCEFCRNIPNDRYNIKRWDAEAMGLIFDDEQATCPSCAKVVIQWEH